MSTPKATVALLEKSGRTRPLKTREIVQCLRKGGVQFGGKNPEGTLYRSLGRDPRFTNVGKSTWGLTVWYPKPPKPAAGTGTPPATDLETPAQPESPEAEPPPETTAEEGGEP